MLEQRMECASLKKEPRPVCVALQRCKRRHQARTCLLGVAQDPELVAKQVESTGHVAVTAADLLGVLLCREK